MAPRRTAPPDKRLALRPTAKGPTSRLLLPILTNCQVRRKRGLGVLNWIVTRRALKLKVNWPQYCDYFSGLVRSFTLSGPRHFVGAAALLPGAITEDFPAVVNDSRVRRGQIG